MKKLSIFLKTLLVAVGIGVGSNAWAQSAYWTEDFEDDLGTGWTLSGASRQSNSSMNKKLGTMDLRIEKKADASEAQYVITPTFSKGVSTVTFWQCRSSNRTLTIYTSTDGGTNWWKYTTITANSSEIATVTINSMTVNRIKIANDSGSDADIDNLTVNSKATVYAENYESTSLEAIQSAWVNNDGSWPTAESKGTYASRLYYFNNQCGNTTKWFCAASKNDSRQTTAYYFFASAYTGKAYQFDAKLNLNVGNSSGSESRLYFMNGAKAKNNEDPSNYLFYIGVNSSGKVYLSNGTDSDVSTIGSITGTENISNTVMGETKNYSSTGWFDASCIIDMESGTAYLTITRNSSTETKSVNFKSGTKQLSGIGVRDGAKTGGVVAMDDIALYELTYPAFTLSETLKEVAKSGNTTVDVTDLIGEISITSADANIATASYADGTITINGVALGTTTLTVSCTNDGFTVTKEIAVTVEHGVTYNTPALYSEDFENEDYNNPGDAGWVQKGGSWSIESTSDESINRYAKFTPISSDNGNRGGYYNFAGDVVTNAGDKWKIEFDAAFKRGVDRTATSIAITSSNSGNIDTYEAASGKLYFLCQQKETDSQSYNVYIGSSEESAVATYTLADGVFYHFVITFNGTTVTAKIGKNAKISKNASSSTVGTLKGLKAMASRKNNTNYPYVYVDNITLHNFNGPAFTLTETEKTINQGEDGTVSVTGVVGEISVESSNTSVATASYANGTITITGVAGGTANITVNCFNNGVNAPAGTIATTIISYAEQYTTAKAVYDAKVENLDAAGQAYWTSNVTDVASVVDAASCSAAIAALPTTYLAAVKAQGAGSDMTDALKTAVDKSSWTNATGTYGGVAAERYNGNTPYSSGKILYQTVDGLHAGYYRVKFYGVANVARTLTEEYYGSGIAQMYANSETQDVDVIYQDACSPISDTYLREFEVYLAEDNSSIEFGIQNIKEGGQWYVAQAHSLTYLGTEKNDYTINAVAGGATIKELATGSVWASDSYGTYVPYVIEKDSKFYVLDDNSTYYKSFTMGATDETKEVNYTLDESVVYFAEANSIYGGHGSYGTYSNDAKYSMGNGVGCYTDAYITTSSTLAPGTYNIMLGCVVRNGNKTQPYGISYSTDKENWTTTGVSISYSGTAGSVYTPSANIQLASTSYLRLTNNFGGNAQDYLDYILIRKTAEPATLGTNGYGTFASPYPLDLAHLPEGLTAYKASTISGKTVTFTAVTEAVQANTGLLLKGDAGESETIVSIPVAASGADISASNQFLVNTAGTTFTGDDYYYYFGLKKNTLTFGLFDPSAVAIPANKAYLKVLKSNVDASRSLSIVFDDEATGVGTSLMNNEERTMNNEVYDLQGRRVDGSRLTVNGSRLNPGIYIKNGRKVVVK